jgi:hypothetical protein
MCAFFFPLILQQVRVAALMATATLVAAIEGHQERAHFLDLTPAMLQVRRMCCTFFPFFFFFSLLFPLFVVVLVVSFRQRLDSDVCEQR